MIWNDEKIAAWASAGGVTPFDPNCIEAESRFNPASLDLRLGNKIRFPKRKWSLGFCAPITMQTPYTELWDDEIEFDSIVIPSHGVALACSMEYITMPPDVCATLMSKSGTGRRLLEHLHAGFVDPSFHGQITYEFVNDGPWDMRLSVGDRLVQLKFEEMNAEPIRSYLITGHYNGQRGATAHVVVG